MIGTAAPLILDGGLASELEAAGHDLTDRLWSARLLLSEPDAIEAVHLAYYRSGAQVATTASYQATIPGFAAAGLDRATALTAIGRSVALAQRARDRFAQETDRSIDGLLVAGSVGPYGAMLADGSEYTGAYDPGETVLRDVHAPRIEALLEAGVDLLAFETIPTVREASVLLDLLEESGASAWLSYQCRDGKTTAAGEPVAAAFALATDIPSVVAVGVNCTSPRYMPSLLTSARDGTDRPLIAYPNGGDRWDAASRRWIADPSGSYDPATVASWTSYGPIWLGGCCGTGPADIAALAVALGSRTA